MKISTIEIIKPGEAVEFGPMHDTIRAEVLEVTISYNGHTRYHISWWQGGTRHTAWVEAFEICYLDTTKSLKVGFK